jgi:excisionase family DNA binding protein
MFPPGFTNGLRWTNLSDLDVTCYIIATFRDQNAIPAAFKTINIIVIIYKRSDLMLWNVKQVAEYLSISISMVYKLVDNFELQAIRVGDCIRFSPEAIEGFILFTISK